MNGLPPLEHFAAPPIEVFRRFPVGRALRKSPPSAQWLLGGYIPLGVRGDWWVVPTAARACSPCSYAWRWLPGCPFLGTLASGTLGVLYVSMEDGFSSLHHRLSRLADHTACDRSARWNGVSDGTCGSCAQT